MNPRILLCLDSESVHYPILVGLEDEKLEGQEWLLCVHDAQTCRLLAQSTPSLKEAWFISCDDMESINVAAAVKYDNPHMSVSLVASEQDGSLASRVQCAHIDMLWDKKDFIKAYAEAKRFQVEGSGLSAVRKTESAFNVSTENKDNSSLVLTIASGGGGVGRSTVSVLLGYLAQSHGLNTVIVDADVQFGDIHQLCGLQKPLRIEHVLERGSSVITAQDRLTLAADTPDQDEFPMVIAAPLNLETSEYVAEYLPQIIQELSIQFDVVIVNMGMYWNESQVQLLEESTRTLFLIDQRPSSLRACIHALDLCSRMGVATHTFRFAINKYDRRGLLSATDASCALRGAHVEELSHGGVEVDEILGAGYPGELLKAKNTLVRDLDKMLMSIINEALPQQSKALRPLKHEGFFARLRGH